MAPNDDSTIDKSNRRVAIAIDSCASFDRDFLASHSIQVAQMRINIGDDSITDSPDLDYSELYRRIDANPDTQTAVAAPVPDQWLRTIKAASHNVEAVICIPVAAGLSASYDSARVAAEIAREDLGGIDIRVIDSGTMSGALKLLAIDAMDAAARGLNADEVVNHIQSSKLKVKTVATIDNLNRIRHIANAPPMLIRLAKTLNIKPVVSFTEDGFHLAAKPFSIQDATRRMIRIIADDIGNSPASFIVLHADAPNRAQSVANQIRTLLNAKSVDISDFHPFTGFYAGRGSVGIAWHDQSSTTP